MNHVYHMSLSDIESAINNQPLNTLLFLQQLGIEISNEAYAKLSEIISEQKYVKPWFIPSSVSNEIIVNSVALFKTLYHLHTAETITSFIQNNYLVKDSHSIHPLFYAVYHESPFVTAIRFENQYLYQSTRYHRFIINSELEREIVEIGQPYLDINQPVQQTSFDFFNDGCIHYLIWYTPYLHEIAKPVFPFFLPNKNNPYGNTNFQY